jgi:hypothetical protein
MADPGLLRLPHMPMSERIRYARGRLSGCVDDDGVIRKEKTSQWPIIRRGRVLSTAKALGSR